MATRIHATPLRTGSFGGRNVEAPMWRLARRLDEPEQREHDGHSGEDAQARCASFRARRAARRWPRRASRPALMPVAYIPVAKAGRSAKRSLTATGISAPATAIPMPTGSVSSSTPTAPGANARAIPATPISATAAPIAAREPTQPGEVGERRARTAPCRAPGSSRAARRPRARVEIEPGSREAGARSRRSAVAARARSANSPTSRPPPLGHITALRRP